MIRVLVVSYAFPPDAAVGGLRIARLCRYLPEHGVQPIVLSMQDRFYEEVDYTVSAPEQIEVVRTKSMTTPLDLYRRAKQSLKKSSKNGGGNGSRELYADPSFVRRQILALLQFPDRYWGWYLPALREAENLLQQGKVDVIFSSGPPWISHLIARRLKVRHQLPWMADFRDPWARLLPEKRDPGWFQGLSEFLEDRCIKSADLVVCNTERLRRAYQLQYKDLDESRFRTLTNGFEECGSNKPKGRTSVKRAIVHLGSIYGLRRIDTFLQAIAQLTRSGKLDPESFQLVFQGDVSSDSIQQAEKNCPDLLEKGCLEFRPRIAWKDAQEVLAGADRLLLFQGNHQLQIPAKFYEYVQTGIPIFAVTEKGALSDLLDETQAGVWVSPESPDEIARRFVDFLEMPRRAPESLMLELNDRFHYRQLSSKLSDWMHTLLGREAPTRTFASSVAN